MKIPQMVLFYGQTLIAERKLKQARNNYCMLLNSLKKIRIETVTELTVYKTIDEILTAKKGMKLWTWNS